MAIKVDESSAYPNFLAVKFLYEGGQTDISAAEVARVSNHLSFSYHSSLLIILINK